ncbi:MAG: hypothetical protein EBU75_01585 [Betaproteobacteria bacterium]|nr:hypothetical protein [Betaproteobacteria bacterium]
MPTARLATATYDQGNLIGLTASFERADGSTGTVADVWLRISRGEAVEAHAASLGDALAGYGASSSGASSSATELAQGSKLAARSEAAGLAADPGVELGEALKAFQAQFPAGLVDPLRSSVHVRGIDSHERRSQRDGWLAGPGPSNGA